MSQIIDKRESNAKREYECKLCHKMNKHSYICHDCRNALQGIPKAMGKGKNKLPRKCLNCGCSIKNNSKTAIRCRDCSFVNNQRRNDIRLRLESNRKKIAFLESGRGESYGRAQRIENLKLAGQRLLVRLNDTYVYDSSKRTSQ